MIFIVNFIQKPITYDIHETFYRVYAVGPCRSGATLLQILNSTAPPIEIEVHSLENKTLTVNF